MVGNPEVIAASSVSRMAVSSSPALNRGSETAFEEIDAPMGCCWPALPRSGLVARDNFRFARDTFTMPAVLAKFLKDLEPGLFAQVHGIGGLIWRVGISRDNYRMVGKPHVILAQAYWGVSLGITNPGCP